MSTPSLVEFLRQHPPRASEPPPPAATGEDICRRLHTTAATHRQRQAGPVQYATEMKISPIMPSHIISGKRAIFTSGEFPLKYLYGSHTQSTVTQYKIKQMIAGKNSRQPLSDGDLSRLFRRQGMSSAHHTIAKHHQVIGATAAALRKRING